MGDDVTGWERDAEVAFVKSKKLNDGEILGLLVGLKASDREAYNKQTYESLKEVATVQRKAHGLFLVSLVFAVLVLFDAVSAFSASGVNIAPKGLKHVALIFMGASALANAEKATKVTYLQAWFNYQFDVQDSSGKADLLLRYPEAFTVLRFVPHTIGYPKFVHLDSNLWAYKQLFLLITVGFSLLVYLLGIAVVWIFLAGQVWLSNFPSELISKTVVVTSAVLILISITMPGFHTFRKTYSHYGMSDVFNRMQNRDPMRAGHFSRLIGRIKANTGGE